jgi:hypothetical protein
MSYSKDYYSREQHPSRQGRLFDPKDYWGKGEQSADYRRNDELKQYAHELGMIKDLLTALLNRIDAIEERVSIQTEILNDIADTLLEP